MWIIIKKMGCCLLILILLPYVVTVFINGPVISARSRVDQTYIKVEVLDAADDTPVLRNFRWRSSGLV